MRIRNITGAANARQRAAIEDLLGMMAAGRGSYDYDMLKALPPGRVEVLVSSDADDNMLAVVVIDAGIVSFEPMARVM